MPAKIDPQTWSQQPKILAERCRGLPLIWTPDVTWFNNDWLGPRPHYHPDATEIAYMAQGELRIEVGGSTRIYKQGDFMIMPPNKYHAYWYSGTETVCFFVVVAPNHKLARLAEHDYPEGAYEGDAPYANVFETDDMPSNEHFQAEKVTLQPGQSEEPKNIPFQDRVVYIISGTAHIRASTLAGTLAANQYQYLPATWPHQVSNPGFEPLVYLSLVITDPYTAHGTGPTEE